MKLGINQTALLRRCFLKGYIGIYDIGIYYHFKDSQRRFAILEKLEIRGLLTTTDRKHWKLTEKGKQILKGNLEG